MSPKKAFFGWRWQLLMPLTIEPDALEEGFGVLEESLQAVSHRW